MTKTAERASHQPIQGQFAFPTISGEAGQSSKLTEAAKKIEAILTAKRTRPAPEHVDQPDSSEVTHQMSYEEFKKLKSAKKILSAHLTFDDVTDEAVLVCQILPLPAHRIKSRGAENVPGTSAVKIKFLDTDGHWHYPITAKAWGDTAQRIYALINQY